MAVAMKDLEIRGAGNMLGGEQSGHIADVGFDLYIRLVGEALAEYRGDAGADLADVKVELPVDAHIPHDYVSGERLRLEAYRRIAAATDEASIDEVVAELRDRYGPLPEPVERLMDVARLRGLARSAGVSEIVLAGNYVRFGGVDLARVAHPAPAAALPGHPDQAGHADRPGATPEAGHRGRCTRDRRGPRSMGP